MLDTDALHRLLWIRTDAQGVVRINQTRLADELVTTRLIVHRVLERMGTEGRLRKLPGASGPATRSYEVTEPKVWQRQHAPR